MAAKVKAGDKVEWETSQGKTSGVVKKKLTAPAKIKGHKIAASKADPQFLVESAKTGKKAAHKPEALKKVSAKAAKPKVAAKSKPAKPAKAAASKAAGNAGKPPKPAASAKAKKPAARSAKAKPAPKSSASAKSKTTTAKKQSKPAAVKPKAKPAAGTAKANTKPGEKPGSVAKTQAAKKPAKAKPAAKQAAAEQADEKTVREFRKLVNLTADQLQRWLATKESKKVGFKDERGAESVGHESGRRILRIMKKRRDRFTDEDVDHVHKVVGYIKRHLAQKPKGDITASNWRYSLMNWGHDPAK